MVFVLLTAVAIIYLSYTGFSYYKTSLEERFFQPDHIVLKPSGAIGHGLGIIENDHKCIDFFNVCL